MSKSGKQPASTPRIVVTHEVKAQFDAAREASGGISHHRMIAAMTNAWVKLSEKEKCRAIAATADE